LAQWAAQSSGGTLVEVLVEQAARLSRQMDREGGQFAWPHKRCGAHADDMELKKLHDLAFQLCGHATCIYLGGCASTTFQELHITLKLQAASGSVCVAGASGAQ